MHLPLDRLGGLRLLHQRGAGAEGRHLEDLAALEVHVRQPEAPADEPAVAEQAAHLIGRGAGGDVEVLGLAADEQVAHAPAHQVGLVAALLEAQHHAHRVGVQALRVDVRPRRSDWLGGRGDGGGDSHTRGGNGVGPGRALDGSRGVLRRGVGGGGRGNGGVFVGHAARAPQPTCSVGFQGGLPGPLAQRSHQRTCRLCRAPRLDASRPQD